MRGEQRSIAHDERLHESRMFDEGGAAGGRLLAHLLLPTLLFSVVKSFGYSYAGLGLVHRHVLI